MRKLANHAARDIASPAVKMGNRSLFPGVAVPLAFFCTLFFRHRKKSVSAPWDGKSLSAPESARQAPPKGNFLGRGFSLRSKQGGFPLAPLHPLRIASRNNRVPHRTASSNSRRSRRVRPRRGQGMHLRAHQRAFRSLRFATRSNRAPHRAASPAPAPESTRHFPPGQGYAPAASPQRRISACATKRFPLYSGEPCSHDSPSPIKGLRAKAPGIFLF